MTNTEFVYTTFIKSTQQKVWDAITNAEFTRQYWGCELVSEWKQGAKWHGVRLRLRDSSIKAVDLASQALLLFLRGLFAAHRTVQVVHVAIAAPFDFQRFTYS